MTAIWRSAATGRCICQTVVWTRPCRREVGVPTDSGLRRMILALTIARRELRGGVRGVWIVLLCMTQGVGVIAAVGALRAAVDAGLASDGRALLGGDLEVDG